MRRGQYLETELNRVLKYLNSIGIHAHKNHPKRTDDGKYLEGEPFDYEVISHGRVYTFDAKECQRKKWNLQNAKPKQIKHLLNCKHQGADSFFLVYFFPANKLIKFDVELVRQRIADGIKSLSPGEGVKWDWRTLLK